MPETYVVTGKRGYGTTRVEWMFSEIESQSCERTTRIYGSVAQDPLVIVGPETVALPASTAAVACIDAAPSDRRTVRHLT